MKRVIKFRAWNGDTMSYNIVAGIFGAFWVNPGVNNDGLDPNDSTSLTPFNTKCAEETKVMQFTGLTDKNGKEIYEGDILRCIYQDKCEETGAGFYDGIVMYERDCFVVKEIDFNYVKSGQWPMKLTEWLLDSSCEITRNIYEP